MNIHLYMLCYRFEALVASHLEPEAFGEYMAMGTRKLSRGNVLFFETDPQLKSDYFKLDDIARRCVPHPDGSPKRSTYISVYRVLEHIPLPALGRLYLTTRSGQVMGLDAAPFNPAGQDQGCHLYQELCPLPPLVVSALAPDAYCTFMTDPGNPVHAPRLFFADLLVEQDKDGSLAGHLPYSEPQHIAECIKEVQQGAGKPTKTVCRTPDIHAFFRTIGRGFFVGDQTGMKCYAYPSKRELEGRLFAWWRSASAG